MLVISWKIDLGLFSLVKINNTHDAKMNSTRIISCLRTWLSGMSSSIVRRLAVFVPALEDNRRLTKSGVHAGEKRPAVADWGVAAKEHLTLSL